MDSGIIYISNGQFAPMYAIQQKNVKRQAPAAPPTTAMAMVLAMARLLTCCWLRSAVRVSVNRCTRATTATDLDAANQGVHGTDSHDSDDYGLQPEFLRFIHKLASRVCATRLRRCKSCRR
jgi:hypothetical protein